MTTPSEHKTVQARILGYAEAIGWTFVSREEAEQRRGLRERGLSSPRIVALKGGQEYPPSLFFDDLLDAKLREFNPRYAGGRGRVAREVPPSERRPLRQPGQAHKHGYLYRN